MFRVRVVMVLAPVVGLFFGSAIGRAAAGEAGRRQPPEWSPGTGRAPLPGEEYTNPKEGSVLVWVPGGEFVMGSEEGEEDEKPARRVKVKGFWLGKFEVTNKQYGRFLKATGHRAPPYWDDKRFHQPDQPVVAVSWGDALDYCEWAGLRLPTEAEWEYAAAGGKELEYPTATGEISHDLANYWGVEGKDRWDGPAPVGSFPPNPFGLCDMAGNAWEWTSSKYMKYPYSATDGREDLEEVRVLRVLRGGAWQFSAQYCRTKYRHRFAGHLKYDFSGLRMALSGEAAEATIGSEVSPGEGAVSGGGAAAAPAYVVSLEDVTMEVVGIVLTDEVVGIDGNKMKITDENLKSFRIAVVTAKVRKPAGKRLTIAAADLTLHYYHGNEPEVAPCEGMSTFSKTEDVDRPIKLPRMSGPGWMKQTTGLRGTQAEEVYFDAVFNNVERDISKVWLCVGQPTTEEPFVIKSRQ